MGQKLVEMWDDMLVRRTNHFFDDFDWYISPHLWTSLAADSGTSVAWSAGSSVLVTAGSTDNNEAAIITTNAAFTMADGKPILGESLFTFTQAATNAANIFFGFSSALAANMMVDDGAGPATNFSGFGIFCVDGGTVWKTISSLGTTQTIKTSTTTAGNASPQVLRVEFRPVSSTLGEITYRCNGQHLLDSNNIRIKDTITYTSAAAMKFGIYAKEGSATAETLLVDYLAAGQLRGAVPAS